MQKIKEVMDKLIRVSDLIDKAELKSYSAICYPSAGMKKESARRVARLVRMKEYYLDELMLATNWEQGENSRLKSSTNLKIA